MINNYIKAYSNIHDYQQNILYLPSVPEWFCLYSCFETWCKPFQQEETPCKSEDINLLTTKLKNKTFQRFHMCIIFCEILLSTDLGTEYDCNH